MIGPSDELGFFSGGVHEKAIHRRANRTDLEGSREWMAARDVSRKHNVSEQTFYRRRSKYGGMEVSEAKRLKALEKENEELKKIVAEHALGIRMLKDVNSKKF